MNLAKPLKANIKKIRDSICEYLIPPGEESYPNIGTCKPKINKHKKK
jgi:hypothetical protein